MKTKTELLQVRIEPHLKAAAEKAAEQERRRLSDWIRVLILERCELLKVDTTAPSETEKPE